MLAALAELSKNSVVVDEIYMSAFLPKVTCDVLTVTFFAQLYLLVHLCYSTSSICRVTIDIIIQLLALLRESLPILSGAVVSEDNVPPAFDQLNNPTKYPPSTTARNFVLNNNNFSASYDSLRLLVNLCARSGEFLMDSICLSFSFYFLFILCWRPVPL